MSGGAGVATQQELDLRFMRRAMWVLCSLGLALVVAVFVLIAAHSRYALLPFVLGVAIAIGWNGYLVLVRRPRLRRSQPPGE
jgi:O-antigen ligase